MTTPTPTPGTPRTLPPVSDYYRAFALQHGFAVPLEDFGPAFNTPTMRAALVAAHCVRVTDGRPWIIPDRLRRWQDTNAAGALAASPAPTR